MSLAGKNLRYLRKSLGMTQEEFAQKLNIKRSLLGAYEEERAEPRIEVLEQVGDQLGHSMDDLLLKDLSGESDTFLSRRRSQKMASQGARIVMVPVKAAAGYLAGYADPGFLDELNTFTLPMLSAGNYRAFEIVGDSMLPTPSGSVIVGEKVEDLKEVRPQHTYIVVSRKEGIVYKRVMKEKEAEHQLTLVSDNPDYQPYHIESEDVLEMWKASLVISKANTQQRWDVNQLASMVSNLQEQINTMKRTMN